MPSRKLALPDLLACCGIEGDDPRFLLRSAFVIVLQVIKPRRESIGRHVRIRSHTDCHSKAATDHAHHSAIVGLIPCGMTPDHLAVAKVEGGHIASLSRALAGIAGGVKNSIGPSHGAPGREVNRDLFVHIARACLPDQISALQVEPVDLPRKVREYDRALLNILQAVVNDAIRPEAPLHIATLGVHGDEVVVVLHVRRHGGEDSTIGCRHGPSIAGTSHRILHKCLFAPDSLAALHVELGDDALRVCDKQGALIEARNLGDRAGIIILPEFDAFWGELVDAAHDGGKVNVLLAVDEGRGTDEAIVLLMPAPSRPSRQSTKTHPEAGCSSAQQVPILARPIIMRLFAELQRLCEAEAQGESHNKLGHGLVL
mmetsp:Transcript_39069/g.87779  ORF Transcript_39069/g.87779 Transcript_39069/m.87779 type:complete len:371 (-) Transcript_39069:22-1134(-)